MKQIDYYLPFVSQEQAQHAVEHLLQQPQIRQIGLIAPHSCTATVEGAHLLHAKNPFSAEAVHAIARDADAEYTLIQTDPDPLVFGLYALDRWLQIAESSQAGMLYADHYELTDQGRVAAPVIDYQKGSLRDDFDFGPLQLYRTATLQRAEREMHLPFEFAGLYDLRLRVATVAELVHLNEYLYTQIKKESDTVSLFSYVDPRNRARQIEMEQACTEHLQRVGGYLSPSFREIDFTQITFSCEASVIIPVRNRVRTIEDAIRSVLKQQTSFPFNLIIIDNHSTDGTTEAIERHTADPRVVHLIPEAQDLGIGGCWNVGVNDSRCGRFAVQLDSDDVYSGEDTLQKIVDAFYAQHCAMVVGTYQLTDFEMHLLPPGVIDHREWTPDNGRNNALRINGLGAPRAFYTPLLRQIRVPNTSYGEDYALGLAFSRFYRIGRIYDVLYLCRRWEDNSDASLDRTRTNTNNTYKDRIRTWELQARIALNGHSGK